MNYVSYQMKGAYTRSEVKKIQQYCDGHDLKMHSYLWTRFYRVPTFDIFKKIRPNVNYFGPKIWKNKRTRLSWCKAKRLYILFISEYDQYDKIFCLLKQFEHI